MVDKIINISDGNWIRIITKENYDNGIAICHSLKPYYDLMSINSVILKVFIEDLKYASDDVFANDLEWRFYRDILRKKKDRLEFVKYVIIAEEHIRRVNALRNL